MKVGKDRRIRDFLRDIAEWGERCARHLDGISYDQFASDERTLDAVSKCVEVVGTAAKNLMEIDADIEARHPQLQLRRAYATRIRLAHGYRDIDPKVLWATATQSVPALVLATRAALDSALSGAEPRSGPPA